MISVIHNIYPAIGAMAMPVNFRYKDVVKKGRPRHEKHDAFYIKHPSMSAGRWAKIFSPFDALEGFDERIAEKDILYERQAELSEEDRAELNRRLGILHALTCNSRLARANRVMVRITWFMPCTDENHFAFGRAGRYETTTGIVLRVETDSILLITETGEKNIHFCNIREITDKTYQNIFSQMKKSCS